jgi:hypothetical protein
VHRPGYLRAYFRAYVSRGLRHRMNEISGKPMIRRFNAIAVLVLTVAMLAGVAGAQSVPKPALKNDTGFASYAAFEGTSDSDGQVYAFSPSVGYNFNRHFGTDLAVPFYFVRASAPLGGTSSNGIGNPSLDLRFKALNPLVNFASVVTGSAPVGDSKKGLSTGRGTYDWTNHFDHAFGSITPFGEVGVSNTVADTRLFLRPFTALGFNTHVQVGANYDLWKFFSVGASGYAILPSGQQTVFSKVVPGQSSGHHHSFENNQQTTGGADLARDHGFSAWVDANPAPYLDMELGYTRSVNYDLNAISFGIGINVGYLARRSSGY